MTSMMNDQYIARVAYSFLKCVSQPEIVKSSLKHAIFQGSRSSMLIFLRSSMPVLVMISSMSVSICNHFYVRRAYSGKITLLSGCPSFAPFFEGIPFTQRDKILLRNTRDNRLSYGGNPKSLSHLVLDWYQVVTDGHTDRRANTRTDRITVANTRYSYASSRA